MNPDDIVTQLGLLLSQWRYSRRAIEDIERSTAKYTGLAFAPLFAEGAKFGQPPMMNGALKVYIVNINDLSEPPTGGLLEGLLGGAGRFLGGLIGGIAGGTVSGVLFPWVMSSLAKITSNLDSIAARIERIVDHLKVKPKDPTKEQKDDSPGGMFSDLPALSAVINDVADLLKSANGEKVGDKKAEPTKGVEQILHVLKEVSGIVDGLILLLPIVTGFLASLIYRLNSIKLAVVELLEWLVRNVLLLRGLVLVVIQETIAQVARLAGTLLHIAEGVLSQVLHSAFAIVGNLLSTAMTLISWIGEALQGILNDVLEWLRTGLGNFLIALGNMPIVQFLFHIVDALPALLPALIRVLNPDKPITDEELKSLRDMKPLTFTMTPLTGPTAKAGSVAPFPDIKQHLPDPKDIKDTLDKSRDFIIDESTKGIDAVVKGMQDSAQALKTADFDKGITDKMKLVDEGANKFANALAEKRKDVPADAVDPGVNKIAKFYEDWLTQGGLETLLANITAHFQRDMSLPEKVKEGTQPETPRSTVQIDQVEIIIEPPDAASSVSPAKPDTLSMDDEPRKWMWSPFQIIGPEEEHRGAIA
jgi:hypothetical protein